MIIISNTSPIINLAVIGQLTLLRKLFGTVVIPQAVYDEIAVAGAGQAGAKEVAGADWLEIKQISNHPLFTLLTGDLDAGEAQAIVLAVELKSDLLLIDERKGREAARRLGIKHIGLLGVLIKAKHEGNISALRPIMDNLRSKAGFWIGEELYHRVLQASDESHR